jgi:hypothetical protein
MMNWLRGDEPVRIARGFLTLPKLCVLHRMMFQLTVWRSSTLNMVLPLLCPDFGLGVHPKPQDGTNLVVPSATVSCSMAQLEMLESEKRKSTKEGVFVAGSADIFNGFLLLYEACTSAVAGCDDDVTLGPFSWLCTSCLGLKRIHWYLLTTSLSTSLLISEPIPPPCS